MFKNPSPNTFYSQRPVCEPNQFHNNNTIRVGQDVDQGSLSGISLPNFRDAVKNSSDFWPSRRHEREFYIEALLETNHALRKLFPQKVLIDLVEEQRAYFRKASLNQLRSEYKARLEIPVVDPISQVLRKPTIEFIKRLEAGLIQIPRIDLTEYQKEASGKKLMRAIQMSYALSGLPRLTHAYGLGDILGHEGGTLGTYAPKKSNDEEHSNHRSRTTIPITSRLAWNRVTKESLLAQKPFIPANMRCVTDIISARAAIAAGLCPIVSYTADNANHRVAAAEEFGDRAFITVRSRHSEHDIARQILSKGGHICIEMANAQDPHLLNMVRGLKKVLPNSFIMVGNVGSPEGYWYAVACGADAVKIGRGPGAGCTTPEETGISPGQVSLAYEVSLTQSYLSVFYGLDVPFILDGGVSTPGHCLQAGFLGAEAIMAGSIFAVAKESPAARFIDSKGNTYIEYFGEASARAADLDRVKFRAKPQGTSGYLPEGGSISEISDWLAGGLRGAIADSLYRSYGELTGDELSKQTMILKTDGSRRETSTRLDHRKDLTEDVQGRY
jgi:IMP dehydrogenase/GMP reductase